MLSKNLKLGPEATREEILTLFFSMPPRIKRKYIRAHNIERSLLLNYINENPQMLEDLRLWCNAVLQRRKLAVNVILSLAQFAPSLLRMLPIDDTWIQELSKLVRNFRM